MPENTAIAAARLLSIVTWLSRQPHQTSTVGELAEHFGRTIGQVERDLDHLTFFRDSLPGESFELEWTPAEPGTRAPVRAQATVTVRQAHRHALPQVFTPELAAHALVGLKALSPTLPEDLRQHLPAAMVAIGRLAPALAPFGEELLDLPAEDSPQVLPLLSTAVAEHRELSFSYDDRRGRVSSRRVFPVDLVHRSNGWVLIGVDLDKNSPRHFLATGISTVSLGQVLAPPQAVADSDDSIRILINSQAQWLLGDFATLEPHQDGVWPQWAQIRVWNDAWVRNLLIIAGPGIEDCDDPQMAQWVSDYAQEACAVWSDVLTECDILVPPTPVKEEEPHS